MRNSLAVRLQIVSLILLLVLVQSAFADEWHTITSGWEPNDIVATGDKIIAASVGGVLIYDTTTDVLSIFNKDNGLSSNTPIALAIDENEHCVWIGHSDASIDIFNLNTYRVKQSIKALEAASNITTINDIDILDGKIYVATDGGFSLIRKDENYGDYFLQDTFQNFGDWRTPAEAYKVSAFDGKLFFALEQGIAVIDIREDHRDYNNSDYWTNYDFVDDLGYTGNDIEATTLDKNDGVFYLSVTQRPVMKWESGQFTPIFDYGSCHGFTTGPDGKIYTGRRNGLYVQVDGDSPGDLDSFTAVDTSFSPSHMDVETLDGKIFASTEFNSSYLGGLAIYDGDDITTLHPNSPGGDEIQELFVLSDGTLWASARNSSVNGLYQMIDGNWIPYTKANTPGVTMDSWVSINTMAEDAYGDLWVGSWGNGIYYFPSEKDTVMMFNAGNSPLVGVGTSGNAPNYVVISGFLPDADGGLWLTNQEAYDGRTLVYIPPSWFEDPVNNRNNNQWLRFGNPQDLNSMFPGKMVRDNNDRIWMGSISAEPDYPIVILDLNGSVPDSAWSNPSRATFSHLSSVTTGFTTVNDITIDENGIIWMATSGGLYNVDANVSSISNLEFEQVSIPTGESASCIMMDPLNQVWVGTNSGVFVLGKDRSSWVRNYEYDDPDAQYPSPIVSNSILAMAFDPISGEAYLGTDKGISVVKTPFRDFGEELGDITVSPQPFILQDFGGDNLHFSSESLVAGAEVRLYTPSGKLVRELDFDTAGSTGWDGKDDDGEIVGSGVYLIVVTTPGGTSEMGKVAVVRK